MSFSPSIIYAAEGQPPGTGYTVTVSSDVQFPAELAISLPVAARAQGTLALMNLETGVYDTFADEFILPIASAADAGINAHLVAAKMFCILSSVSDKLCQEPTTKDQVASENRHSATLKPLSLASGVQVAFKAYDDGLVEGVHFVDINHEMRYGSNNIELSSVQVEIAVRMQIPH